MKNLHLIAKKMVSSGKGILAADESTPTCTKRFEGVGIESSEKSRNGYRSTLLSTEGLEKYISGVILYDETFHQNLQGTDKTIPNYLKQKGILTGIKVDTGAKKMANHDNEKITEGLDGLRERLQVYKMAGADFAKWRAVINIGKDIPSRGCIYANAHALARYASLCQENDIVPVVEPEVLMDGEHHIEQCLITTEETLKIVFQELRCLNVDLKGIILKPNMVLPGKKSNQKCDQDQIIKLTFEALINNVPDEVPGIAFLSGGQTSDDAAKRLNLLNKTYNEKPWNLTFSYGRALQKDALIKFAEKKFKETQKNLLHRAHMNHLASLGEM